MGSLAVKKDRTLYSIDSEKFNTAGQLFLAYISFSLKLVCWILFMDDNQLNQERQHKSYSWYLFTVS